MFPGDFNDDKINEIANSVNEWRNFYQESTDFLHSGDSLSPLVEDRKLSGYSHWSIKYSSRAWRDFKAQK